MELNAFHQDVILYSKLPDPKTFVAADGSGLDLDSVKLEVWTQLIEAPEAIKTEIPSRTKGGQEATDLLITFGDMRFGTGGAFPYDANDDRSALDLSKRLPVQKAYEKIELGPDGSRLQFPMQMLIETMPFADLAPALGEMPDAPQANVNRDKVDRAFASASAGQQHSNPLAATGGRIRRKPAAINRMRAEASTNSKIRSIAFRTSNVAKNNLRRAPSGYVLDYELDDHSLSTLTVNSDQTIYVNGVVYVSGAAQILGGAVIKYNKGNNSQIVVDTTGSLSLLSDRLNPIVCTAKDDNTVGEVISGSTGTPTGYYAGICIGFMANSGVALHDLRIRYADYAGVYIGNYHGPLNNVLSHSSFIHCDQAVVVNSTSLYLRNVLFSDIATNIVSVLSDFHGENVTFDSVGKFVQDWGGLSYAFTNSIFCNVTGIPSALTSSFNVTNNSTSQVFQQIGGGKHYLTDTYRNKGTTNINSALAAELKAQMSTYPPLWITNDFTADTILTPNVQHDVTSPGYHYLATDYIWGDRNVTNAVLTLTNGVTVALYGTNGVVLRSGSEFHSTGLPNRMNTICRYQTVQEDSFSGWDLVNPPVSIILADNVSPDPEVQFRFTRVSELASSPPCRFFVFNFSSRGIFNNFSITDSHFVNSYFLHFAPTTSGSAPVVYDNNIFKGCLLSFEQLASYGYAFPLEFRNNFCDLSTVGYVSDLSGVTWNITDNVFSTCVMQTNATASYFPSHNAYYSTASLGGSGNITNLSTLNFTSGPLGSYYYPSSGGNLSTLIDAGSRNATNAGLYQFTTLTNSTKEGTSTVDIGFHYVATDSNGIPLDSDGDLLPDYFEDSNGNGLVDGGESSWTNADSDGDGIPDGFEVGLGTNPLVDEPNNSGQRVNYIYDKVGRLRTVSGKRTEAITADPETNVTQAQ